MVNKYGIYLKNNRLFSDSEKKMYNIKSKVDGPMLTETNMQASSLQFKRELEFEMGQGFFIWGVLNESIKISTNVLLTF